MSIDYSKIKQRLTKLQNKGGGGDSNFWRPKDGETVIRIVPTVDGDPFKDFWFHYSIGNEPPFLSPKKNFGENDAIDAFVRKLFNEGTEDSVKMAKNLLPRQRFFTPVLVRGEEHLGVRIWGFGKMAYEKLLNLVLNPEYGDITDSEEGTDLVISYGKPAGATFPQTAITPRRQSSLLCEEGPDRCRELMENIPDVNTLFERKTVEQVEQILDKFLAGDELAEDRSSEVTKYNKKTEDTSDVETAFKELLNA